MRKTMSFTKLSNELLVDFLHTSFQNVRSSNRTKPLHDAVLREVLNVKPDLAHLTPAFEYKILDAYGKEFTLDIALLTSSNEVEVAILVKALNSSVQKNIKNYANTTVGEAARCMYGPNPPKKVYFITLCPRIAPCFNKAGEVTRFDHVANKAHETDVSNVLLQQYDSKVLSRRIFYDIDEVEQKSTQAEFEQITISNIDDLIL